MSSPTPDVDALKNRLKAMWMAGDYGQVAAHIEKCGREFVGRVAPAKNDKVLDVACGNGNLALEAARLGATVTGVDIATNLLEQARERARAEGLEIQFDEGDAESLSYDDASFDLVVSMFGAMFAPRPPRVAEELVRVCRPGGRIAMANWTPGGFVGDMFKTNSKHVPPPPGMSPPLQWGEPEIVRERLQEGIADLQMTKEICVFDYPFSPAEVVEFFRKFFGPTISAFGALDEAGQAALRKDLEQLYSERNLATDGTTRIEGEYLEVIATRA